jgi:hypothetical protein
MKSKINKGKKGHLKWVLAKPAKSKLEMETIYQFINRLNQSGFLEELCSLTPTQVEDSLDAIFPKEFENPWTKQRSKKLAKLLDTYHRNCEMESDFYSTPEEAFAAIFDSCLEDSDSDWISIDEDQTILYPTKEST